MNVEADRIQHFSDYLAELPDPVPGATLNDLDLALRKSWGPDTPAAAVQRGVDDLLAQGDAVLNKQLVKIATPRWSGSDPQRSQDYLRERRHPVYDEYLAELERQGNLYEGTPRPATKAGSAMAPREPYDPNPRGGCAAGPDCERHPLAPYDPVRYASKKARKRHKARVAAQRVLSKSYPADSPATVSEFAAFLASCAAAGHATAADLLRSGAW